MIVTAEGPYGAGKTLFVAATAYSYHLKGKAVISNMSLNFPHRPVAIADIFRLEEWIRDAVLVIDEGHYWFDAQRSMSNMAMAWSNFQDESRKRKLEVLITTQSFRKMNWRVRDAVDVRIRCYFSKKTEICRLSVFDVRDGKFRFRSFRGRPYFGLFGTYDRIQRPKRLAELAETV